MANRSMICPACGFLRCAACETLLAGSGSPSCGRPRWLSHCQLCGFSCTRVGPNRLLQQTGHAISASSWYFV